MRHNKRETSLIGLLHPILVATLLFCFLTKVHLIEF